MIETVVGIFMDTIAYAAICVALALIAATGIWIYGLIANARGRARGEPFKPFRWR